MSGLLRGLGFQSPSDDGTAPPPLQRLTYVQSTGQLLGLDFPYGAVSGYSGLGDDRNNPDAEDRHGTGPIPRGVWSVGAPEDHPELGPFALPLSPLPDTETFGRSGFFFHGENQLHPLSSSHGCIVLSPRAAREAVWGSGIRTVEVVATPGDAA